MDFTCLSFELLRSPQPVCVKCMIIFLGWKSKSERRGGGAWYFKLRGSLKGYGVAWKGYGVAWKGCGVAWKGCGGAWKGCGVA